MGEKRALIILTLLLCGFGKGLKEVDMERLQNRQGVLYEVNSQVGFTGIAVERDHKKRVVSKISYTKGIVDNNTLEIPGEYLEYNNDLVYYRGELFTGKVTERDYDGNLEFEVDVKNGKFDGLFIKYYKNGQIEGKINYKKGNIVGENYGYYKNGQLEFYMKLNRELNLPLAEIERGNFSYIFTKNFYDDIYIETYYENGQLKYKSLKNNKLNDLIKTYHENGEVYLEGTLNNDKFTGYIQLPNGKEIVRIKVENFNLKLSDILYSKNINIPDEFIKTAEILYKNKVNKRLVYENGEKKLWSTSINATNIEFLGSDLYKVEFNIKSSTDKNEYKSYYSILNRNGKKIHSGYFEKVEENFKDGYIVKISDKNWGILDRDGKIRELSKINQYNIEEPWDELESLPLPIFENGIVRINEDEKIGAINLNGDIIIKPEYRYIEISKDFIIATKLEDIETEVEGVKGWSNISKQELFDLNGTKLLPDQYSKIEPLDKNILIVGKDSKEYLINLKENKIISEKYDAIQKTIVNNLLEAHLDDKVGYINNLGKVKIDLKYDRVLITMEYADYPYSSYAFNEEYIFLERDKKAYLVNSKGKEISEIGKSDDFDFYNGFGIFKYGIAQVITASGEYGYINTKGETIALYDSPEKLEKDPIVQEIKFKGAKKETDFKEELICEMKNDKFGYVDSNGNYVIPPKFDWGSEFKNNQAIVMIDFDYRILKKDGTFLLLEK